MRLSIFGARGVPARWGGWDTIVTELGPRLVRAGHEVTLYAMPRYTGQEVSQTFEGTRVTRLPTLVELGGENLRSRAAVACRERIRAFYDWDKCARDHDRFLRWLAGEVEDYDDSF